MSDNCYHFIWVFYSWGYTIPFVSSRFSSMKITSTSFITFSSPILIRFWTLWRRAQHSSVVWSGALKWYRQILVGSYLFDRRSVGSNSSVIFLLLISSCRIFSLGWFRWMNFWFMANLQLSLSLFWSMDSFTILSAHLSCSRSQFRSPLVIGTTLGEVAVELFQVIWLINWRVIWCWYTISSVNWFTCTLISDISCSTKYLSSAYPRLKGLVPACCVNS